MRTLTLGLLIAGSFACNQGAQKGAASTAPQAAAPSESSEEGAVPAETVVATWDGGQLTYGQLQDKAKSELRKARIEYLKNRSRIERQFLESMVLEEIVNAKAKEAGQDNETYIKSLVGSGDVSDADVQKFYDENKERIPQGIDAAREQIRGFLTMQQQRDGMKNALDKIKDEANVKLTLPEPSLPKVSFELAGRPSKGPETAKVTLVEFSDFQCPYCARASQPVEEILAAYPDQVRVVFLHFPLESIHPQALAAAVAAECAHQQGKFWEMHDKLFENQRTLTAENFTTWASELGLDADKFASCSSDSSTEARVRSDMTMGEKAGVGGTPSFYINGTPHSGGVPSVDAVKPFVES